MGQRFAGHETTLRQVSATLRQSAVNFTQAQSQVANLQRQASRLGLVVGADGSMSLDPSRLAGEAMNAPQGFVHGAPDAIQIADRFHLLQNLTVAVDKVVRAHRKCLRSAGR